MRYNGAGAVFAGEIFLTFFKQLPNNDATMLQKLNAWLESVFHNSDVNKLLAVGATAALFLWFFTDEITPLFGGALVAYLLEGEVQRLERHGWSRTAAAGTAVVLAAAVFVVFVSMLPLLALQLRGFAGELPSLLTLAGAAGAALSPYLPAEFVSPTEAELKEALNDFAALTGKFLLDRSFGFAANVFSLFLYLVLLPLLVFFLLKDKAMIMATIRQYAPSSPIFGELWASVDEQFGSYVRGKFIEAGIIGSLSWLAFHFWDLNYAFSLAALIGLSVFVPFVGAIAVTFPVLLVAYAQFGGEPAFFWVVGLYAVIQIFDGQVLVPLLFSEVVKLHPVAIFAAIIFFGGLWGVWGVFFAIPLASLIKSVLLVINARRLG